MQTVFSRFSVSLLGCAALLCGCSSQGSDGADETCSNCAASGGQGSTTGNLGGSSNAGQPGSGSAGDDSAGGSDGQGAAGQQGQGGAGGTDGQQGNGGQAAGGAQQGGAGGVSEAPAGFVLSPYKDTSINMNWNTNIASTQVSGAATALVDDLTAQDMKAVTLAFATGECGTENWGGIAGDAMAMANAPLLDAAGIDYVLATGGAAGSFSCDSNDKMTAFIERWASPHLKGIDYDIEAGQSGVVIRQLIERIEPAHAAYPNLRFSLTIATLANNDGATTAQSLGPDVADSLNVHGLDTMQAALDVFGTTWPPYLTVNLMTMDYGAPGSGVCVVNGGECDMGQSAIQAAYNLHDKWGVPFANIELTPMIGLNDVVSETFKLQDVDTVMDFALAEGLAGVHWWSYDRDVDCEQDYASPTCNSTGDTGAYGFLQRFAIATGQ